MGAKWTPAQRKKFIETMKAKRDQAIALPVVKAPPFAGAPKSATGKNQLVISLLKVAIEILS